MPFDFRTFFLIFSTAFRERMSRRRRNVVVAAFFLAPFLALFNAACLLLDHLLFPRFRDIPVRGPVFLVGHARSGTTLMHRLMAADDRSSWYMTYELFLPSIVQRKVLRCFAALDERLFGGAIARRIRAWEDKAFAGARGMHALGLTAAEEDEFLLMLSFLSGTWVTLFPYMSRLDYLYYVDRLPARRRWRILSFYRSCVQRQLYLNGPDKFHLSKNPTFAGKMETLIEMFPDARFVVLNRNPYETIPSLLKMMKRTWKMLDCDPQWMQDSYDCLARQSFHTYKYPYEVLARHPETRHAVVDYRQLVAQPKKVVADVYRRLGLTMTPEYDRYLDEQESRATAHRPDHVYSLEEFSLGREEIRAELAELFDRFAWDGDEAPSETPGFTAGTEQV